MVKPLGEVRRSSVLASLKDMEEIDNGGIKIKLDEIRVSPLNFFGMRDIEKLSESIKEHGLIHPVSVRKITDPENSALKYELISGERRYRAAKLLGWTDIKATVIDVKDELDAEEKLIIVNLEQRELNDIEKSKCALRLREIIEQRRKNGKEYSGKRTRDVIAELMNANGMKINTEAVTQLLKMDNLIPEIKEAVKENKVSRETAYQYAQMDPERQKELFDSDNVLTAKEAKQVKNQQDIPSVSKKDKLKDMIVKCSRMIDKIIVDFNDIEHDKETEELLSKIEKFISMCRNPTHGLHE